MEITVGQIEAAIVKARERQAQLQIEIQNVNQDVCALIALKNGTGAVERWTK